jgi:hypothetical protein
VVVATTRLAAEVLLVVLLEEGIRERDEGRRGVSGRGGGGGERAVEGTRTMRPSTPPVEIAMRGMQPAVGSSVS